MSVASLDYLRLKTALEKATAELLTHRNAQGYWEGELSSSALSTATAVTALAVALKHGAVSESEISNFKFQIDAGLKWLAAHPNADGGWGDTTKSLSNISTTTLCWAAFGAADADGRFAKAVQGAEQWLASRIGVSHSAVRASHSALAQAIIARYGKDRTFSVPILTLCALAGRLGNGRDAWKHIIPLPFELAAFPHQLFAALRLPVVSYALPALIAIGQAHHVHAPSANPFARLVRSATREKTLRVLTEIQPGNGGFLEATPLTSFVTMSLAASGQANHIVTQRGIDFLRKSQRTDGSWPIDTNLATWCTTLATDALPESAIRNPQSAIDWLLNQQYKTEHPYTHAAPGGWAWTDLPGGVPDADDTAGALVALAKLSMVDGRSPAPDVQRAAEAGIHWLLSLQNRDGGIPTFCRGWGALPFDRSSPDITAHALRAWRAWYEHVSAESKRRIRNAERKALRFLLDAQIAVGAWCPLWFGNEHAAQEENLVYGTSRVLAALCPPDPESPELRVVVDAAEWLIQAQNADGGWGHATSGVSSVEETGLALEALAALIEADFETLPQEFHTAGLKKVCAEIRPSLMRGADWLVTRVENGVWCGPSPIGFYFAKLWYFERLYPLIFAVGALRRVADSLKQ